MFSDSADVGDLEYSLMPRDDVLNYKGEYVSGVLYRKC